MGSRGARARKGIPAKPKVEAAQPPVEGAAPASSVQPPIPDLTRVDVVFGEISHLPKMADIPDEFWRSSNPYCRFVSDWFFRGVDATQRARLTPRADVPEDQALRAIRAILASWAPKHEHKEAGAAYLLSCWFELDAKRAAA